MRRIVVVGVIAGLGILGLAAPAAAAPTADTTTTVDVGTGTLDITAPASAALGTGIPGSTVDGSLGAVTVTDTRGVSPAPWTASVYGTDFSNGTFTIPIGDFAYWSGPATATVGDGTFTPGQLTRADRQPLDVSTTPLTAFSHTGGTGGNSAAWDPGIVVSLPSTAQTGTYTGTVTHSVL